VCLIKGKHAYLREHLRSSPVFDEVKVAHLFSFLCCVVLCLCVLFVFVLCLVCPMLPVSCVPYVASVLCALCCQCLWIVNS